LTFYIQRLQTFFIYTSLFIRKTDSINTSTTSQSRFLRF